MVIKLILCVLTSGREWVLLDQWPRKGHKVSQAVSRAAYFCSRSQGKKSANPDREMASWPHRTRNSDCCPFAFTKVLFLSTICNLIFNFCMHLTQNYIAGVITSALISNICRNLKYRIAICGKNRETELFPPMSYFFFFLVIRGRTTPISLEAGCSQGTCLFAFCVAVWRFEVAVDKHIALTCLLFNKITFYHRNTAYLTCY